MRQRWSTQRPGSLGSHSRYNDSATCPPDLFATDSDFLVNAFSVSIRRRQHNASLTLRAKAACRMLFQLLKHKHMSDEMDELEYSSDGGLNCQMWHVPPCQAIEAIELANLALNGA
ncbi:uncharacterized protein PADG_12073 [Paracoccidioides brasiliensis Pb18]|uniref:Uncharacterized protein n=1 Tax=Paracoccidioides brasiliensis (strain Pb18) TaxID=502780 RepID=A0A0A0HUU3_PARBD|nr:uncharacterized protein PADG_12073 [Paracoccidioides brasiliensis Pb18]KGM91766.1 hypothetical protein PADG_12073 [Paracoccidioides brasiliensis Pb18]